MKKIGLHTPKGFIVKSLKEAKKVIKKIGFPIILRPSFTLGGAGGGVAENKREFFEILNILTLLYSNCKLEYKRIAARAPSTADVHVGWSFSF